MTPQKRRTPRAAGSAQSRTASANSTAWRGIAVKPSGQRVPVGICPTQEAAESWAAMLRAFSRPLGGDALVEREAAP